MGCVMPSTTLCGGCVHPFQHSSSYVNDIDKENENNNHNEKVKNQGLNDFSDFFVANNSNNHLATTQEKAEPERKDIESQSKSQEHNRDSSFQREQKQQSSTDNQSVKLMIYSNHTSSLMDEVTITPNQLRCSSNNKVSDSTTGKFSFGKDLNNDCVINDSTLGGHQFFVYFNNRTNKFYAIDNLNGTGLFVRINKKIVVDHDMIVSFCVDHMYLQVTQRDDNSKDIKVKFLQEKQNKESVFNSKTKQNITIGRGDKCDIVYKEESVSKTQCTLIYSEGEWTLYDGLYTENECRASSNGLWLLANKSTELTSNMVLKTGTLRIVAG